MVNMKAGSGYTLMEVAAVIVVMSIVAVLAYPSLVTQIKRIRSEEGIAALSGLYLAQKNHYADTGAYASDVAELEVSIPAMENFDAPTVYANTTSSCGGSSTYQLLASVADVDSEYILYLLEDGRIVCTPCAGICTQLGFSAW